MSGRIHTSAERRAAIRDLIESGDTIAVVADRHGIARSTLGNWTNGLREDLGYHGGWESRGGVMHPLFPERRTA